jgi:hypothetical protein
MPPELAEAVWQMMLAVRLDGRLPQTTVDAVETIFRVQAVILGTADELDEEDEQPDIEVADSEAPAVVDPSPVAVAVGGEGRAIGEVLGEMGRGSASGPYG